MWCFIKITKQQKCERNREVPNLTQCAMCVYMKSKTWVDRILEKCKGKITSTRMHHYKPPTPRALKYVSPGCKRLLIDCFVDCLLLDPQSCVKVHSDLAASRWGNHQRCEGCCCWSTCSSQARQRGCSLHPTGGVAGCWTLLGRRRAAVWRREGLPPPHSGSPKSHL